MSTISETAGCRAASSACLALLAYVVSVPAALAQFTEFNGGKLQLKMEGNMSPFALASNTGARGAMNNVTSLYPSASSLFGNPASLSRLQGMDVQTDFFLPGLGLGVSSERIKLLRNNLRAPVQDFLEAGDSRVEHPVYPDVDLGLYQSTSLGGFSVAVGGPSATIGAGVQQPFRGQFDFALGGMRVGLGVPEEASNPGSDSIKVQLSADGFARLSTELNDFSLGVAGQPWPGVHVGLAYQRYTLDLLLEGGARIDGIVRRGGRETRFHTDRLDYQDDLDAEGYGDVSGSAHGIRLGASWRFAKHFGVDAMINLTESMLLKGDMGWEYHVLPSLDFGQEEILDASKMNPDKPTLTLRSKTVIRDMRVNLPWEAAVSLYTEWESFRVNLDYSYFMRGMSIQFAQIDSVDAFDTSTQDLHQTADGGDSVEVLSAQNRFHLGLKQQFALGLQFHQVFFQIGGVFYTVTESDLLTEAAAYRPEAIPFLPTMNLGYFFPLGPNFTATVSLVAFPVSLFKTSVEYRY